MKNKAFSLIELLVTLIILSLVLLAFIPLLTKKLKANDITVGSFGKGGGGSLATLTRNVTKEDCDKYNALYISAAMNDGIKPICVTKWNVGDNVGNGGVPIAGNATKLKVGETCNDTTNCCWQGQTAGTGEGQCSEDGNGDSTYGGCNRTVCQWNAAYNSCFQYAPKGTTVGMWRLPKKVEMDGWVNHLNSISIKQGKNGLQFCDWYSGHNSATCYTNIGGCVGGNGTNNTCDPHHIWSSDTASPGVYYNYRVASGKFELYEWSKIFVFSARCVLDSIIDSVNTNEEDIEKDKHLEGEPQSQKDCDKLAPNLMFIDKAYNGTLGKNTCVTKYNIGDSGGPHLANIVDKTDVNHYCDGGYCCWVGKTSAECSNTGNGNSTYSGCNRTVCQWKGANATCALWAPDGRQGYWRLPSKTELEGWGGNLNKITLNMGKDGLQLCDVDHSTAGSSLCAYLEGACPGSADGYCNPSYVWSSTQTSLNNYYGRFLGNGVSYSYELLQTHAFSSRCVYDGDYHYQNIQKEITDRPQYRQPYSQKDCDPFNAMFIPAKYNGTGGKNLCVTKYNAFDTNGPLADDTNYATIVYAGTKVTSNQKYVCWRGWTNSTTGYSGSYQTTTNPKHGETGYLGYLRTVCGYGAAVQGCLYWVPYGMRTKTWRLPTKAELEGWAAVINTETIDNPIINKWMGSDGLQFCDYSSRDHGMPYCTRGIDECPSAAYGCVPNHVWGAEQHALNINNGVAGVSTKTYDVTEAFSVRCVTEQVPNN